MRTIHKFYFVLIVVAVLAGCGEGTQKPLPVTTIPQGLPSLPPPSATPSPLVMTPPPGSVYLGVYVNPAHTSSPAPSLIGNFETSIGRTLALSPHYYGFYDTFPGPNEQDDVAHGRVPFISWNCQPPNAAVASGRDDPAIKKVADNLKAFGYPVFIRYMWEMNLSSSSGHASCYDPTTDLANGFFSPTEFIAAWKRIRYIFAQENVHNVVWVWNPSGGNDPVPYYPGGDYVDWVAFDFYDRQNFSFASTFSQVYTWLAPLGKPILIGETGATQDYQQQFFADAPTVLQSQYPAIEGMIYFDATQGFNGLVYNWSFNPTTLGYFSAMAHTPYMSAMPAVTKIP